MQSLLVSLQGFCQVGGGTWLLGLGPHTVLVWTLCQSFCRPSCPTTHLPRQLVTSSGCCWVCVEEGLVCTGFSSVSGSGTMPAPSVWPLPRCCSHSALPSPSPGLFALQRLPFILCGPRSGGAGGAAGRADVHCVMWSSCLPPPLVQHSVWVLPGGFRCPAPHLLSNTPEAGPWAVAS